MTDATARTCPTHKPPAARTGRAWTAALLLPLITGCATTGVVLLGSATRAAKPADCRLDVFAAREDVRRRFDPFVWCPAKAHATCPTTAGTKAV